MERPLLRALRVESVLLIDEIDRADSEFEAFLLEFLSRLPDHDPGGRDGVGGCRRRSW